MLEEKTGGVGKTQNIYGASYSCKNSQFKQAICWLNTGGTEGIRYHPKEGINNDCGETTHNDYLTAFADTFLHCNKANTPWSGFRFWLGTGTQTEFLVQRFPNAENMPINRFCTEIEFPEPHHFLFLFLLFLPMVMCCVWHFDYAQCKCYVLCVMCYVLCVMFIERNSTLNT